MNDNTYLQLLVESIHPVFLPASHDSSVLNYANIITLQYQMS